MNDLRLTAREASIVDKVIDGAETSRHVAKLLDLKLNTVQKSVNAIGRKIGAKGQGKMQYDAIAFILRNTSFNIIRNERSIGGTRERKRACTSDPAVIARVNAFQNAFPVLTPMPAVDFSVNMMTAADHASERRADADTRAWINAGGWRNV